MNVAEKALGLLFPQKKESRKITVKYSRAFQDFNANVHYDWHNIQFRLSHKWKDVDEDLQIGVIQSLLLRIYKKKKESEYVDLYNSFVKKLSTYSKVDKSDPILETSFHRVNEEYFNGMMDRPNLVWGSGSATQLGHYEYARDTITISTIFKNHQELLDYIMYHELLHKKLKFYDKNGRSYHHTHKFRQLEKKFKNPNIEKELDEFLRKHKMKNLFRFW